MFLRTHEQFEVSTPLFSQEGERNYQFMEVVGPVGLFHLELWTGECVPIRMIMTDLRHVIQGVEDPKVTEFSVYYQSRFPKDDSYKIQKLRKIIVKDSIIHFTFSNNETEIEEHHLHMGGLDDLEYSFSN